MRNVTTLRLFNGDATLFSDQRFYFFYAIFLVRRKDLLVDLEVDFSPC